MATALTGRLVREIDTPRGRRFVELTAAGVVIREPGRRNPPPPVPFEAIEDLGLKSLAASNGVHVPRPRRARR